MGPISTSKFVMIRQKMKKYQFEIGQFSLGHPVVLFLSLARGHKRYSTLISISSKFFTTNIWFKTVAT